MDSYSVGVTLKILEKEGENKNREQVGLDQWPQPCLLGQTDLG